MRIGELLGKLMELEADGVTDVYIKTQKGLYSPVSMEPIQNIKRQGTLAFIEVK